MEWIVILALFNYIYQLLSENNFHTYNFLMFLWQLYILSM